MPESSTDVREWLHSRTFVLWDMDGGTRVAANGRRVVDGPLLSLFNGHHGNRPGFWEFANVPYYPNGYTADEVNRELYEELSRIKVTRSVSWDPNTPDFMDHLRRAEEIGGPVREVAYTVMTTLELNSVFTSQVATGAEALTARLRNLGVKQGIATNNSIVAAHAALRIHDMADGRFRVITGRPQDGSLRLKPHPDIVRDAVRRLRIPPERHGEGVFIEDSVKNVAAAQALGIPVIGISGGSEEKERRFREAGATFVVGAVKELWIPGRLGEARKSRERALNRAAGQGLGGVGELKGLPPPEIGAGERVVGQREPPERGVAREVT